jgi:hypothetical protein
MPASKKTEQLVVSLLTNHPWLVEDDKFLLLAVWKQQGLTLSQEQKEAWFNDCATPESITRIRRKLIEDRIITQSEVAQERRKREAEVYRQKYARQKSLI